MQKAKTLVGILAAAALAPAIAGCTDPRRHEQFHYDGTICGERVVFYESGRGNYLKAYRPDGSIVEYGDSEGDDLRLDYVKTTAGKNVAYFRSNSDDPKVLQVVREGQEQFNRYLENIIRINASPIIDYQSNCPCD